MSTAIDDISETIQAARLGDAAAFARIVRQYQALVSGVLFSVTGDFHKSEDFAQETFLIAWKKLDELRDNENIAAWLCTIARNLVNRSHRKQTIATDQLVEENPSTAASPEQELLRKEQSELIWSAIGNLDEKYRETLVLYYRSGQSVHEIASVQNLTEETVRQRLLRARQSLKSQLEQMIGDILTESAPGDVFTFGVMAVITGGMLVSTTETVLAATTGTTTAATVGTTAGTGTAAGGKAAGIATFWAVLGPLAYVSWFLAMFIGMFWAVVRNAPTLRARRYRVYSIFWCIQYYALFTIVFGGVGGGITWLVLTLFFPAGLKITVPYFLVYFPLVMLIFLPIQAMYYKKFRGIIENDLGLPGPYIESFSYRQVERRFFLSIITNTLILETIVLIFVIAGTSDGSISDMKAILILAGTTFFGAIIGVIYYVLGRYFLEICRTKANFLAAPPLMDDPFEAALWKTAKRPDTVDHPKQAGKMYGFVLLTWIGSIAVGIWYMSHYSWDKHPVTLGICVALFFCVFAVQRYLFKKVKNRKLVIISSIISMVTIASLIVVLEIIEFGHFSLKDLWSVNKFDGPFNSFIIRTMNRSVFVMTLLLIPVNIIHWFKTNRDEKCEKKTGRDMLVRDAIANYRPEESTVDETPIPEALPFPKRWIYGFGIYGVMIILMFCLASLIPNPYAHRKMLERNNNYSALIKLYPDNAEYYWRRGALEAVPEKAIEDLNRAIQLKPDLVQAYMSRAIVYNNMAGQNPEERQNRFMFAIDDCNTVIRQEPKCAEAWELRAMTYGNLKDPDAAIADYTRAIHLIETAQNSGSRRYFSPCYIGRASQYEAKEEYQKAIDDYKIAAQLEKENGSEASDEYFQARCQRLYEKLSEHEKAKEK